MIWAVAFGGAAGSVLRYLVSLGMKGVKLDFPIATLLVNVTGCLLIGLFVRVFSTAGSSPVVRAALTVGFCGGFTTFSTFSAEFITLVQGGRELRAVVYVVMSVTSGILATLLGMTLGNRLIAAR